MEPAPRPPLELLAELPVEEPLDADVPPREPPAVAAGAPAAPTSAGAVEPSEDADEADLNFSDPELFLAPGDPAGAAPAVRLAEAPKPPRPRRRLRPKPWRPRPGGRKPRISPAGRARGPRPR